MRIALATLLLAFATVPIAAHAEDNYAGRYAAECGRYVCELDVAPRPGGWTVRWTATDPTVLDAQPACAFTTTAELGSAEMGSAGVIVPWRVKRIRCHDAGSSPTPRGGNGTAQSRP